jgi:magnesium chelatase subunit D
MNRRLQFSAIVGQEEAKLALLLAAVDPLIGGVLLRGQKGSGKTTLARGLADLVGRFVDLPLGTTEDRLIGTLDLAAALQGNEPTFRPGLLAAADGGVLYVDEINLLPDHLVDVLLDVAVSGENLVERDGISHRHPARFVLVGSMNPEEGELRPQLLDRFGLCVDMAAPASLDQRVEAVRRVLTGAHDPGNANAASDTELAERLAKARPAVVPAAVVEAASRLALAVGAEGMRADITLCRGAAALAGLEGRSPAGADDVARVAPLVLAHRTRRGPLDPPTLPADALHRAIDAALAPQPGEVDDPESRHDPDGRHDPESRDDPDGRETGERPLPLGEARRPPTSPPRRAPAPRGRYVRAVPATERPDLPIAALSTARALAARRIADPTAGPATGDLRADLRVAPAAHLVVVSVDLSGSMGTPRRATAATGAVLGLLDDAYQRRHRVALVAFRGDGADVLLSPTSSIEIARNRLSDLATGGATPLAAGIRRALDVIRTGGRDGEHPLLVLITDGRATGRTDALERALEAAAVVRRRAVTALVLDCEDGPILLGLASRLAAAMGARHVRLADVEDDPARAVLTALPD